MVPTPPPRIAMLMFSTHQDTKLNKNMLITSLKYALQSHKEYCAQSFQYMEQPFNVYTALAENLESFLNYILSFRHTCNLETRSRSSNLQQIR